MGIAESTLLNYHVRLIGKRINRRFTKTKFHVTAHRLHYYNTTDTTYTVQRL
jgi:hypothetical protein